MEQKNLIFNDEYLNYIENIPPDDRESVLKIHVKRQGATMSDFELFAIMKDRDINKLSSNDDTQ